MTPIVIRVLGLPAPQGSKRAYVRGGRAMLVESSAKVAPWRADVRAAAIAAMGGAMPTGGAVRVTMEFLFARPRGHMSKRGGLLHSAPAHKVTRPDLDKLVRSSADALTGLVWRDDSQVVRISALKRYAYAWESEGAIITVARLDGAA